MSHFTESSNGQPNRTSCYLETSLDSVGLKNDVVRFTRVCQSLETEDKTRILEGLRTELESRIPKPGCKMLEQSKADVKEGSRSVAREGESRAEDGIGSTAAGGAIDNQTSAVTLSDSSTEDKIQLTNFVHNSTQNNSCNDPVSVRPSKEPKIIDSEVRNNTSDTCNNNRINVQEKPGYWDSQNCSKTIMNNRPGFLPGKNYEEHLRIDALTFKTSDGKSISNAQSATEDKAGKTEDEVSKDANSSKEKKKSKFLSSFKIKGILKKKDKPQKNSNKFHSSESSRQQLQVATMSEMGSEEIDASNTEVDSGVGDDAATANGDEDYREVFEDGDPFEENCENEDDEISYDGGTYCIAKKTSYDFVGQPKVRNDKKRYSKIFMDEESLPEAITISDFTIMEVPVSVQTNNSTSFDTSICTDKHSAQLTEQKTLSANETKYPINVSIIDKELIKDLTGSPRKIGKHLSHRINKNLRDKTVQDDHHISKAPLTRVDIALSNSTLDFSTRETSNTKQFQESQGNEHHDMEKPHIAESLENTENCNLDINMSKNSINKDASLVVECTENLSSDAVINEVLLEEVLSVIDKLSDDEAESENSGVLTGDLVEKNSVSNTEDVQSRHDVQEQNRFIDIKCSTQTQYSVEPVILQTPSEDNSNNVLLIKEGEERIKKDIAHSSSNSTVISQPVSPMTSNSQSNFKKTENVASLKSLANFVIEKLQRSTIPSTQTKNNKSETSKVITSDDIAQQDDAKKTLAPYSGSSAFDCSNEPKTSAEAVSTCAQLPLPCHSASPGTHNNTSVATALCSSDTPSTPTTRPNLNPVLETKVVDAFSNAVARQNEQFLSGNVLCGVLCGYLYGQQLIQ